MKTQKQINHEPKTEKGLPISMIEQIVEHTEKQKNLLDVDIPISDTSTIDVTSDKAEKLGTQKEIIQDKTKDDIIDDLTHQVAVNTLTEENLNIVVTSKFNCCLSDLLCKVNFANKTEKQFSIGPKDLDNIPFLLTNSDIDDAKGEISKTVNKLESDRKYYSKKPKMIEQIDEDLIEAKKEMQKPCITDIYHAATRDKTEEAKAVKKEKMLKNIDEMFTAKELIELAKSRKDYIEEVEEEKKEVGEENFIDNIIDQD